MVIVRLVTWEVMIIAEAFMAILFNGNVVDMIIAQLVVTLPRKRQLPKSPISNQIFIIARMLVGA